MKTEIKNVEVVEVKLIETPDEAWTLDQLGSFCRDRHQRMAADAWMVGRALTLAKARCQKEGASFTNFKQTHGFSDATASRYMRLYEHNPSEAGCSELTKIGIMEALEQCGVSKKRSKACDAATAVCENDGTKTCRKENVAAGEVKKHSIAAQVARLRAVPSWAVKDDDDDSPPQDDSDAMSEVWSVGESLEQECREVVPAQVEQLSEKIEMVLGLKELHLALPPTRDGRQKVMDKVVALEKQLVKLKYALVSRTSVVAAAAT